MTTSDVKYYLRDIVCKQEYIKRLEYRKKMLHLEVSFGTIDYSADRVQTSLKNKMEEAAVKLSERIERIDEEIARVKVEIDDRIGSIEKLDNSNYKNILYMRYVNGMSFEEISVKMGYVYNYTCNLHGDALTELSKLLNFS